MRFGFDIMKKVGPFKQSKWETTAHIGIQPLIKLVTSVILLNSFFFVAHANAVSVYDLQSLRWCGHLKLPQNAYKLLRTKDKVLVLF